MLSAAAAAAAAAAEAAEVMSESELPLLALFPLQDKPEGPKKKIIHYIFGYFLISLILGFLPNKYLRNLKTLKKLFFENMSWLY
jgi:hypothetical protein